MANLDHVRGLAVLAVVLVLLPATSAAPPSVAIHSKDPFATALDALKAQDAAVDAQGRPSALLDQQLRTLRWSGKLVAALGEDEEDTLRHAVGLAKLGTMREADALGFAWGSPMPLTGHAQPGTALEAISERLDLGVSTAPLKPYPELDALPPAVAQRLARVLDAFLALDAAARQAFANADPAALRALQIPNALHAGPGSLQRAVGIDLAPVFPTRNQFLDAILDLADALRSVAPGELRGGEIDLCPLVAIDLSGQDSQYVSDCAFILDLGGHDTYLNNAGGNRYLGSCAPLIGGPAAALIDLGGNDRYGTPAAPRVCGANGGGGWGVGFLLDAAGDDTYTAANAGTNGGGWAGAGFLLDVGGYDSYTATDAGVNGGGSTGSGFLLDLDGSDIYMARGIGANGGGNFAGAGSLIDLAGDDVYASTRLGTNGGAATASVGFLIDARGHDTYQAGGGGTNGGSAGAVGLLIDLAGNDQYTAQNLGANGGASSIILGVGLLLDAGGTDAYQDSEGGTGTDRTVIPKGLLGAQVDLR